MIGARRMGLYEEALEALYDAVAAQIPVGVSATSTRFCRRRGLSVPVPVPGYVDGPGPDPVRSETRCIDEKTPPPGPLGTSCPGHVKKVP